MAGRMPEFCDNSLEPMHPAIEADVCVHVLAQHGPRFRCGAVIDYGSWYGYASLVVHMRSPASGLDTLESSHLMRLDSPQDPLLDRRKSFQKLSGS